MERISVYTDKVMDLLFYLNSILLGVGLAMDAFSVSIANGLHAPGMGRRRSAVIAGTFGFFQFAMPMIGWVLVRTLMAAFRSFQKFVPWIALLLLLCIGGKMLLEGIRHPAGEEGTGAPGAGELLLQGIATSIDALSVGFTIERYPFSAALVEALIIGAVTFLICLFGLFLGRRAGERLAGVAPLVGGVILIGIGVEIFLTGVF